VSEDNVLSRTVLFGAKKYERTEGCRKLYKYNVKLDYMVKGNVSVLKLISTTP
jgi:hypothetical protein